MYENNSGINGGSTTLPSSSGLKRTQTNSSIRPLFSLHLNRDPIVFVNFNQMDNGFSSPRRDVFPTGLRVLVIDDDLTWLRILEKMLKKCSYEVTTCCLAREALNLLRENKDGYDIVISNVNMPNMDGFKLLEHI